MGSMRKSSLSKHEQGRLIEHFVAEPRREQQRGFVGFTAIPPPTISFVCARLLPTQLEAKS